MLSTLSGSKKYTQMAEKLWRMEVDGEKEDVNMCWMFDEMEEKGRKIGEEKGRREERIALNNLFQLLKNEGRMQELMDMIGNIELQEKLMKQYGLL